MLRQLCWITLIGACNCTEREEDKGTLFCKGDISSNCSVGGWGYNHCQTILYHGPANLQPKETENPFISSQKKVRKGWAWGHIPWETIQPYSEYDKRIGLFSNRNSIEFFSDPAGDGAKQSPLPNLFDFLQYYSTSTRVSSRLRL